MTNQMKHPPQYFDEVLFVLIAFLDNIKFGIRFV